MIRLHGLLRLSSLFVAMAAASAAHALGVGEVSLNSRLNQPLDAKIALFEAAGLDANEVIVRLASPEAFERVGLDRPYFLTDLKFSPRLQGAQGNIIVTSSKPVREPYLSFLIEVIWPNGRMLREYTLLLDPPLYAPTQQAIVPTPAQTPQEAQPVKPSTQPARSPTTERTSSSTATALGGQYQTQNNDTLWEIASNFSPSANNIHQTMLAIQDLNPQAFINNNINLLKKGQILRLPDEQQIKSRRLMVALREVEQQNNAWREARGLQAERQIDATRREAGNTERLAEPTDNLRLLSATSEGSSTSALNERLAAAQENLDSSRRENEDLKSRMSDLEGQLEKLQRLVELKDASLAQLQAQLEQAGTAENADTALPVSDFNGTEQENVPSFVDNYDNNDPIVEDNIEEAAPPNQPETATPKAAPEITSFPPVQEEQQWWESLLEDNAILLWGGGGVALLLALLLLAARVRRNAKKRSEHEQEAEEDAFVDGEAGNIDLAGLNLSDKAFDEPPSIKEPASKSAQQEKHTPSPLPLLNQEALLDDFVPFEQVETLDTTSDKSNPVEALDDFADFDLQLGDESSPIDNAIDNPLPDLMSELESPPGKKDEFGFTLDDKLANEPIDNFDDFALPSDNAPILETVDDAPLAQEILDDLDFAELNDITAPSVQATAESEQPKPRQAAEFKASDDDFDFLSGTDETETKLDLARAYIDMGDMEGARDILDEVMAEGSDSQRSEAQELMTSLA